MHRTTDIQQTIETKEYTIPIRIYSTHNTHNYTGNTLDDTNCGNNSVYIQFERQAKC